jgi:uncharacterized damage-inducible protein DinB
MTGMEPTRVYDYLMQARSRMFDWVRPLSAEAYAQEHPIGLRSPARTLHHIRAAEWHYMQRIAGRTGPIETPSPEYDPDISKGQPLAFEVLERGWIAEAEQARRDIAAVTDWSTPLVCTTIWDGRPYAYRASRGDVFAQLVLHEVHHRAQALHMLTRLGVQVGEIDYNALMWESADTP